MTESNRNWRKNLWVLLFGTFITGVAFNEVIPFMSLYISDLGTFTSGQLSILSGIVYAASFLVVALTAPFWGKFADRHGRKRMILQTALGSAISIALMGCVTNVWQFIGLRFLQGFFDGVIPNCIALVATETPRDRVQSALSILSTGYTSGFLLGPIFGGILVSFISIRVSFFVTGILLFSFFLMALLMVTEDYQPDPDADETGWHLFRNFPNPHFVLYMLLTSVIVQSGLNAVFPIITLYVKQLLGGHGPIAIVAGLITALPGMAMVLSSPIMGRYGDRHGASKALTIGFIIVIIAYFPQGFATSVTMLGIFRFINGIGNAGVFPSIQTLFAKGTPPTMTGMAFSLNQGAQAIGSVIGAIVGGVISNFFGYSGVFYFAAATMIINLVIIKWRVPEVRKY
ncbi:MFS transporter [Nicoliella spurrieriana]|uniref:MFS transporter n=1 Tax=Nicoliella spurrieriana TaxID=2925830 RepID=A0A976X6G7_9LACO|nr:MFS transporter [Nicoliella spurrieriana]UQS87391.1 MFS transporter [Nicoliella spurrieriana]